MGATLSKFYVGVLMKQINFLIITTEYLLSMSLEYIEILITYFNQLETKPKEEIITELLFLDYKVF